ncbi:MAG: phenylacetate-CoA oxygenase subunit PaaC [Chitinophagaceae bacterium]|nr:phenylacetate-CoA oxygenase subunit PaaC [Chitinophagaceae bacterium]
MADQISNISTTQLFNYTLNLADNSLIMGHRLSEWTGHGPILEQDIAMSNIALDLVGQSRNFYQYAAQIKNKITPSGDGGKGTPSVDRGTTEDSLAYLRDADEFKNIILVELPNGDWGYTIAKLFFFSTWQFLLYQKLIPSSDAQLSAIAEKSLKEVTYHVRWSSEWMIRLGDGTDESHQRIQKAIDEIWNYTAELFLPSAFENACYENNIGVAVSEIKNDWTQKINDVLKEATLTSPAAVSSPLLAGKEGRHTSFLQEILDDMQYLQRTYPGCKW